MQNDYTHFTVILDRSGSMQSIRDDAIGGFNAFLSEQQAAKGRATLTLVQFDGGDPYEVIHHFRDLKTIPPLNNKVYVPRGNTPLLDAVGRGINDLEQQLNQMGDQRPAEVAFVVLTDGQENSSREFSRKQVQKMLADKQEAGWRILFLSADMSAVSEAVDTGVRASRAMYFDKSGAGIANAFSAVSSKMARARSIRDEFNFMNRQDSLPERRKQVEKEIDELMDFNDEERAAAAKSEPPKK